MQMGSYSQGTLSSSSLSISRLHYFARISEMCTKWLSEFMWYAFKFHGLSCCSLWPACGAYPVAVLQCNISNGKWGIGFRCILLTFFVFSWNSESVQYNLKTRSSWTNPFHFHGVYTSICQGFGNQGKLVLSVGCILWTHEQKSYSLCSSSQRGKLMLGVKGVL